MPVVKSKEETKLLLSTKKGGMKPVIFGDEISSLKVGDGLFFSAEEWKIKTTPSAYYYSRFRKGKDVKTLSINKVDGGYLITKL